MLYAIDDKLMASVPHSREYRVWLSRLSTTELDAIRSKLNSMITEKDIHTSSWMPGKDWNGTVFMPIYEKACMKNVDVAAMCFGLILWEIMMKRTDKWVFIKYDRDDRAIVGTTYIKKP